MVDMKDDVYLLCEPGHIRYVNVGGAAKGCGISKILTQLCLNEAKVHNVGNSKNKAIRRINALKKAGGIKSWVKSSCEKIVALKVVPVPEIAALSYLKSAVGQGYEQMFVLLTTTNAELYGNAAFPKNGACSTEDLMETYDANGNMSDGDEVVSVYGGVWFFCFPKTSGEKSCTIL